MTESGVKDCELLFLISPTISCAERSGRACRRQAVSPAIIGAENEVPSFHAVFPSEVIVAAGNPDSHDIGLDGAVGRKSPAGEICRFQIG